MAKEPKKSIQDRLLGKDRDAHLSKVADNTLAYFEAIANAADELLDEPRVPSANAFATLNSFTAQLAIKNHNNILDEKQRDLLPASTWSRNR
jgi:hypothetical protein